VALLVAGCTRGPAEAPFLSASADGQTFQIATPRGLYLIGERSALLVRCDGTTQRWEYGFLERVWRVLGIATDTRGHVAFTYAGASPFAYHGIVILGEEAAAKTYLLRPQRGAPQASMPRALGLRYEGDHLVVLLEDSGRLVREDVTTGQRAELARPPGVAAEDDLGGILWVKGQALLATSSPGGLALSTKKNVRVVRLDDGTEVRRGYAWSASHLGSFWFPSPGPFVDDNGAEHPWGPGAAVAVGKSGLLVPFRSEPTTDGLHATFEGRTLTLSTADSIVLVTPSSGPRREAARLAPGAGPADAYPACGGWVALAQTPRGVQFFLLGENGSRVPAAPPVEQRDAMRQ
jgi:hypothetical protein